MLSQLLKRPFRVQTHTSAAPNTLIEDGRSTVMPDRVAHFNDIPGMLPRERGVVLYSLAYSCAVAGDIVEVGSWQGRSTCYLAQACKDSHNGIVRAIDHFQGNVGSTEHYVVGRDDLTDLETNFRRNVADADLDAYVRLYNMNSEDAIIDHSDDFQNLRMLFIDGDHSYKGCRTDIELLAPRLAVGGFIAFDDYHSDGPGVVDAVRDCIFESTQLGHYGHFMQFQGLLVARKLEG